MDKAKILSCGGFVKSERALVLSNAHRFCQRYIFPAYRAYFQRIHIERRGCMLMDRIALALLIVGGVNWGSVGLFRFDIVAWLFGGQTATVSRVVYTLVGLAALWCVSLLFRSDAITDEA